MTGIFDSNYMRNENIIKYIAIIENIIIIIIILSFTTLADNLSKVKHLHRNKTHLFPSKAKINTQMNLL